MVLIYKKRVYPIVVACLVAPKYLHVSVVNFHLDCEVPLLREFKTYLPGTQGLCAEFYTPLVLQTTPNTEHAFSEVGIHFCSLLISKKNSSFCFPVRHSQGVFILLKCFSKAFRILNSFLNRVQNVS